MERPDFASELLQADLSAETIPFSEKFTRIDELPERHPLRVSAEIQEREPWLAQVLADFYRGRSHQAPMLEQTDEVRTAMGAFAAAYERFMVALAVSQRQAGV